MYWLKTKIKHILYNNFTDREFTKFMKIRALTCQLGEIPKDYQIATVCPQKTYESICKRLANDKQTLSEVLAKDIEDASEVEEKRDYWKRNKRQQREKKVVVHKDKIGQSQQEIRVDKIRLNTEFVEDSFKEVFNGWLSYKQARKESYKDEQSLKALYKKMVRLSNNSPKVALEIIEQSMANNWAGLFELRNNGTGTTSGTYDWTKGLGDKNANI